MSRFFDLLSKPAREMGQPNSGQPIPSGAKPHLAERRDRLIRLDSNESPFWPSARAIDAMRNALAMSNSYPDDDCSVLRHELASHHELQPDQVLVTAGSTALLSLLCQTLLAPGLNAVTSQCSFIVYSMAVQAAGGRLVETAMRDDGLDLEAMLNAIDTDTRLVFLANPNNPTGTMLDAASVKRFVARVPGHVLVVLDEAYYEFALHFAALRGAEYSNSLDYVRRGESVVVLRTFSKAHGLAGLRVGYGLGPAELLGYCTRMRNTFSVSSVAQAAAVAATGDLDHIRRIVENNAIQSRELAPALSLLGFRVLPTWANFLFCDLGEDAAVFANRLLNEGVAVRPLGAWGAPNCIRVTIGTAEQNQAFLQAARLVRSRNTASAAPAANQG